MFKDIKVEAIPMYNLREEALKFHAKGRGNGYAYTMTVDSAASAVLDFKPKEVYPYHYRGTQGLSDVTKFKNIVNNKNPDIQVIQLDWYKNRY